MTLKIRHFPTEQFLLQQACKEINEILLVAINDTFKKYQIDKPKSILVEL